MANQKEITIGAEVTAIVSVWGEDEKPSAKNFFTGKVTEIVERAKNCIYVKLQGLDRLIPIDRVSA